MRAVFLIAAFFATALALPTSGDALAITRDIKFTRDVESVEEDESSEEDDLDGVVVADGF
ncbi:uncharacterized protein BDV14DRAFT_169903 [Aspergillus stella-maris]|uniref:uncharacterized protein n=1 Tax=Aspergillus stella-maris TaxID=1810926 RepID=UPI003CCD48D5